MKLTTITVLVMSLMIASSGCSGDSKADKAKETDESQKDTAAVSQQIQDSTAEEGADSLAQVRFPIRNENNPIVTIGTDFGELTLELYHDVAPAHADSFVARTKEGFYDGTISHRIVKNFMIQAGDPTGTGRGNAGYYLNAEFSKLPHQEGTLSAARSPDPNSASCQFFVCFARNNMTASLDGQYTVFGQLIKGFQTLKKLSGIPVGPSPSGEVSKPTEDVYLRKVFLSDAEGNPL